MAFLNKNMFDDDDDMFNILLDYCELLSDFMKDFYLMMTMHYLQT